MIEKDFSLDLWGKEIYWEGNKVTVDSIGISLTGKKEISFKGYLERFSFTYTMHELSFEPPFVIKEDCKHHRFDNGHNKCVERKIILQGGTLSNVGNCHNCPDYEKEKKLVRYYAEYSKHGLEFYLKETPSFRHDQFPLGFECSSSKGIPIKVCPDTNRIYIDCEVENE